MGNGGETATRYWRSHPLMLNITNNCQHHISGIDYLHPDLASNYVSTPVLLNFILSFVFHSELFMSKAAVQVVDFMGFEWRAIDGDRCFPRCLHGRRVSLYSRRTQRQADGQPSCLMLMHTALWQAQRQADLSQAEIMPG